jgi:DNA-binding MarR family transcriptional regulator
VAGSDKRSRLPDALLRVPALTPKALAARLKVAPQTGTALLRALQGRGVVREVTGRGEFPRLRDLRRHALPPERVHRIRRLHA